MKRAVIYARFSSNNQREESIDAQIRACREYARVHDMAVVTVYADRAKSGTTAEREQFQQMISDAKGGGFDTVLVHKLDRFSRDRLDMLLYKRELSMCGVSLESVLERIGDDPESVLLESLLAGMNEFYSRNLAREVRKGLQENALRGIHNGGIVPFGFKLNNITRKLEVEESEAEGVRMAFDLYLSGVGYGGIAERLNDAGYTTRNGKAFSKASLHGLLINEKYCGKLYYGKIAPKDVRKKRNHHKFNESYTVIEGGCPAIVSVETFEAAQEKITGRKRGKRCDAKVCWKLSGLLKCGECGETMIVKPRTRKKADGTVYRNYYYACPSGKNCATKSIPKELLEDEVLKVLEESLSETFVHDLAVEMAGSVGEGPDYSKQIAEQSKKLENLSSALANGAPWAAIAPAWESAEAEKKRLEKLQADAQRQSGSLSVEDAEAFLRRFGVLSALDDDGQREALHRNVKEIIINRENQDSQTWSVRVVVNPRNAPQVDAICGVYGGTASPVPAYTPKTTIVNGAIVVSFLLCGKT